MSFINPFSHGSHYQVTMPPTKPALQPRRPIRRFELQDVRFNGRASLYKDPQLVLKPQLDLVPIKPTGGSRLRMPVWRYYLMVHVKDRAEELVKLDLADFQQPEDQTSSTSERFVRRAHHEPILYVRYPKNTLDGFSILRATLKVTADLESVLKELSDLGISVGYHQEESPPPQRFQSQSGIEPHSQPQSCLYHPIPNTMPGTMPTDISGYHHSSSPPYLAAPSSPYPATPSSSYQTVPSSPYPATPNPPYCPVTPNPSYQYSNTIGFPDQSSCQRAASQPIGYPGGYQSQHHWSSPVIPSPAATTIGIPGVLGAGIYKVSKLGSSSSSRSRSRKKQASRGLHDPRGTDREEYFEQSPSTTQSSSSRTSNQESSANLPNSVSVLRRVLQRVQSVLDDSQSQETISQASTLVQDHDDPSPRPFGGLMLSENEEKEESSQLTTIATNAPSQAPTSTAMVPYRWQQNSIAPAPKTISAGALLHLSQIQHEGLVDATRLWNEMMEKARRAISGVEDREEACWVLSEFKEEFSKRWDRVVASTVREMKEVKDNGHM